MNTWASKFLRAVSLFALLTAGFGATGPALAQTCVGNCGTDGADGVVTLPPSGDTSYQWISTAGGVTGAGELPGISGGTDGSSFQTATFAATAGQALTFNFNFVTSDGTSTYPDYAWAQLQTSTGLVVATLFTAETTPTGNTSPGQGLPPNQATLTPSATAIIPGGPTWSPLGSSSGACFAVPAMAADIRAGFSRATAFWALATTRWFSAFPMKPTPCTTPALPLTRWPSAGWSCPVSQSRALMR